MASPMFATAVTGVANIAGNVVVTGTTINFGNTFSIPSTTPPPMETGDFAGLTGGTIGNLNVATEPVGTVFATPVTGFIDFSGGVTTPVMFDLTEIAPGFGTLAGCASDTLGNECTPTGSPFTIIQSNNSVIVDLTLYGNAYTGTSTSGYSPYTVGAFTTQSVISGGTISSVLAAAGTAAGANATYSASFTATAVPEPASILLMGAGLLGAGLVARRKVRS